MTIVARDQRRAERTLGRLREIAPGVKHGLLLRVLYLSLDPYMRGRMDDRKSYAKPVGLGEVMTGESVCEVMTSDQADYALGDIVLAPTGWRTHATSAGRALRKLDPAMAPITGSACSACRASPLTRVST
jgi:NADPH-dependent curcumin reductase CurA